jgi:UDP-N-acetyl-D-glucosamine/UDP-N-acetyl-D-galactosamine dehydrogenase
MAPNSTPQPNPNKTSPRKLAIVGLGYVGLPLATLFAERAKSDGKSAYTGSVMAFDINPKRIDDLKQAKDHTGEVDAETLKKCLANESLIFSADPATLAKADFIIVAVPTPIDDAKSPDLRPLLSAAKTVGQNLKKGSIVVFESTVYPGCTEEDCVPVLEQHSGLKCGQDFFVAYSPERVNPGDKEHTIDKIVKVVAGQTAEVRDIACAVYGQIIDAGIHPASSIKVAEAAKVIENTQRDLNIALMNELSMIFDRMKIDTLDVLAASGTKWNFLPFRPGLVGGHCIGVDPYYLTQKADKLGYHPQVILSGRRINDGMGAFVAEKVVKLLLAQGTELKGARVTVLGFTFKENVPDLRNTRVVDIIKALREYQLEVQVHDPLASAEEAMHEYGIELTPSQSIKPSAAVVLAVPHKEYLQKGWSFVQELLPNSGGVVADLKGALSREAKPKGVVLWRL